MGPVLKEGQKKSWEVGTPGGGRLRNVMVRHTCVGVLRLLSNVMACHTCVYVWVLRLLSSVMTCHICVCVGGCPEITVQCHGHCVCGFRDYCLSVTTTSSGDGVTPTGPEFYLSGP